MILSAHQPAYIPWLGYFDKIKRADLFVYMDNVQFEKNSFINRNKIKTSTGALWLTIPVHLDSHFEKNIKEILVDERVPWTKKHLKSIFINYKKAKYFDVLYGKLEKVFFENKNTQNIDQVLWGQLLFWLNELEIKTPVVRLSSLNLELFKKEDLIFALSKHFGATKFIAGANGKDYLNPGKFKENGIAIEFQNFVTPEYPQLWGEFIPNLSIIDYCMNNKPGLFEGPLVF